MESNVRPLIMTTVLSNYGRHVEWDSARRTTAINRDLSSGTCWEAGYQSPDFDEHQFSSPCRRSKYDLVSWQPLCPFSVTQADWSGTYRGKPRSPVTLSSFCRSQALRSCSSSGKNRVCIFSLRLSSGSILLSIIHHYDLYALFTPFFAAIGFAGLCAGAAAIAAVGLSGLSGAR